MSVPQVNIIVKYNDKQLTIPCKKQQSILDALTENHIFISAVCAGRGTCGKCRIKVLEGEIAISREDELFFSKTELEEGYRLSCTAYPGTDCTISYDINEERDFYIVTDSDIRINNINDRKDKVEKEDKDKKEKKEKKEEKEEKGLDVSCTGYKTRNPDFDKKYMSTDISEKKFGIGIDIGTTTIAMQLTDLENGEIIDTFSTINKQRSYGADVISRIESSNKGKKEELRQCIVKDLTEGIGRWINPDTALQIEHIVIAGNTTMIHLLMVYSCETLGVYPFTPVNIKTIYTTYDKLLEDSTWNIPIVIFPGISAFVGGDIVAGLLTCNFADDKKLKLLIDLGTNGEMAIGNSRKIIAASTAAGPVFEGGNITFGTGSIPGAICNVNITEGECHVKTIAGKPPIGICGTGVIEAVCELFKEGIIDETGLLREEYFEDGYPLVYSNSSDKLVFTQKDIREIQLAKSAIRAGVEILLRRYGVSYEDIDTVYLAGGFGYKVDVRKAMKIGLLPKEFDGKVQAVGNSSLSGTVRYICDKDAIKHIAHILDTSHEINLSNDMDFNELYVKHMYF